jgi:hypothetical protein
VRNNKIIELKKDAIPIERKNKRTGPEREELRCSSYTALPGDRIIFFSDGVTQAGMGREAFPGGWGIERVREYLLLHIESFPRISAGDLAKSIVKEAERIDGEKSHDDISCAVVYFREPRKLLVITGPPFHPEDDGEVARIFSEFAGKKIILGGTTAKIISRETGKVIKSSPESNAVSVMEGADLVCEGILTLGTAAEILSGENISGQTSRQDDNFSQAARRFVEYLLSNDRINFVVGTKINEVHYDPTMPVDLEIRRGVIKKIAAILETKYMKYVHIRYI